MSPRASWGNSRKCKHVSFLVYIKWSVYRSLTHPRLGWIYFSPSRPAPLSQWELFLTLKSFLLLQPRLLRQYNHICLGKCGRCHLNNLDPTATLIACRLTHDLILLISKIRFWQSCKGRILWLMQSGYEVKRLDTAHTILPRYLTHELHLYIFNCCISGAGGLFDAKQNVRKLIKWILNRIFNLIL